jgi:2-keto-4-pentenoate hydratase/2-oxohepta-3-ene-1,7-dioic acid hydratase in catechol pathway
MKFASILIDQQTRTVVVDPEQMLCSPIDKPSMVSAMSDFAEGWIPQIDPNRALPFTREQLLAPLSRPPHNIMCVGKHCQAHAREFHRSGFDATAGSGIPDEPIVFTKPSRSISGPYAGIPLWPGLDESVDYEAELAVVIGRGGRMISRGFDPPRFLKDGDVVECAIEGIGSIVNRVKQVKRTDKQE